MKKYVIVAPHADDEIIGCYELLETRLVDLVVTTSTKSIIEMMPSSEYFGFSVRLMDDYPFDSVENRIFVFPDPVYEMHPEHRKLGSLGEVFLRAGQPVIFYSTNMLSPYIHEVKQPEIKLKCLNTLYPNKKALWKYEHKYFLFEGYTQWLMDFDHE